MGKKRAKRKTVKTADKSDGHDATTGRFVEGNAGGPGRPSRETERAYLDVFRATITPDELAVVLVKILELAKGGDVRAAEILLKRTVPEKVLVDAAVSAAVTVRDSRPFDPIAAYQANPELRDRALQLERDIADAESNGKNNHTIGSDHD